MNAQLEAVRALKSNCNVSFTPDGPRGPRYHLSRGPIHLASLHKTSVIPVAVNASRYWECRSWDRFQIPKPFCKLTLVIGKPIAIPPDLTAEQLEFYRKKAEDALNEISAVKPSDIPTAEEIAEIEDGRFTYLNEDKLVKIENETVKIQPEDVLGLSIAYNMPELRNNYCCHQCPIGERDAPRIAFKDNIHEMLVNMTVTLESVNTRKMRLMEILADGEVDDSETKDLDMILEELEKISVTVESIQLWCEKMKLIDEDEE
jgi:hypothetical protein